MKFSNIVKLTTALSTCFIFGLLSFAQAPAQEQKPQPEQPKVEIKAQPVTPAKAEPLKPAAAQPATPAAPVDPEKAPKAVIDAKEFDAGSIPKGETIKHDFIVENTGKGTLEISRVQPACGCTLSEYDKTVEPGKKGKITLSVNTTNFRGPISKSTSVSTNDPNNASFQLIIKADIKEIISIKPSDNIQMGLVFKGQKQEKEFTLTATDDTPFSISQVDSTDAALKYELKMSDDKKSATFKVFLPEDHPVGPITGKFTLTTTHPKVPTLILNTFGTIREPLTVYPQELTFAGLSKEFLEKNPTDNMLTKPITIAYETASDLEIKKVTSSLPYLKTTVEMLEGEKQPTEPGKEGEAKKDSAPEKPKAASDKMVGKRFSVKVQMLPSAPVGDFSGQITIETSLKTITIPVKGKVF